MKFHFFIFLFTVICLLACEEDKPIVTIEEPDPYETVFTSFNIPNLGIYFHEEDNLCQSINVYQDLSYGGDLGFEYINGLSYYYGIFTSDTSQLQEVLVRFRIRGFEEITTSRLETSTLYELCQDNPEQCFANLFIEYDNKRFNSMDFQSIPFWKELKDSNAVYSYSFLKEPYRVECFENRSIIPTLFEFDGYIYTEDRQDSLKITDFRSQFWVLESF